MSVFDESDEGIISYKKVIDLSLGTGNQHLIELMRDKKRSNLVEKMRDIMTIQLNKIKTELVGKRQGLER